MDRSIITDVEKQFDDEGRLIEICSCDINGNIIDKDTFKYDSNGNNIEFSRFYLEKLTRRRTFKYDSKGNEIEQSEYGSDGSLIFKITTEYDSKGNTIKMSEYDSNSSLVGETFWDEE